MGKIQKEKSANGGQHSDGADVCTDIGVSVAAGKGDNQTEPDAVAVMGQNVNIDVPVAARMSERLITDAGMLGGISTPVAVAGEGVSFGVLNRFRCVADVGCDHGYVSIYLVQKGIAESAIAMDVRKGPLSMAESNIAEYGLEDKVKVRLSDGLSELKEGEADALVIAGMGGKLMISILEKKDLRALGIKTAILQPQSDIPEFRQYLRGKGYLIENEKIVLEDGKYYFPMRVQITSSEHGIHFQEQMVASGNADSDRHFQVNGAMSVARNSLKNDKLSDTDILRICNRYGEHNIIRRDPLLKAYLEHGLEVNNSILATLSEESHSYRVAQIKQEISDIELVLTIFE